MRAYASYLTPDQTRWWGSAAAPTMLPSRTQVTPPVECTRNNLARALASAMAAGPVETDALMERASRLLGDQEQHKRLSWLRPLTRRVEAEFGAGPRPRAAALAEYLLCDEGFERAFQKHAPWPVGLVSAAPAMAPIPDAADWRVAPLTTVGQAASWLGLSVGELRWFADCRAWERRRPAGPLRHYQYRGLTKRFGQTRLIEAPKPRLKALQRQVLERVLDRVPPHDAAHGFRRGRSVGTFAAPHAGQRVVLKIDLQDFFPSIAGARVAALFRSVGYPEPVADVLTGLCTNSAPPDVWAEGPTSRAAAQQRRLYSAPHLPQGAPTSPALANLIAYRLDCRLAALAKSAGGVYTRYADDLAFSGGQEFLRSVHRFRTHACATAMEQGFSVNHHKTRVMPSSQQQRIAGLVVNERPAVSRVERGRLKAILSNCIRHGPESQNRDGHADFRACLQGRVAWVEMACPPQGAKLRSLLDLVDWTATRKR
ncbi:Reverse transcriptase (RNA-dependent DNA polymerase) [Posidoniimonas corsicana]|uniref:RNA-directed DNA polymerase n=1 Tax=Posidoniimonas corsicana TaxID=1938618 RepID=A0A5C5VCH0_9BACT|nr:reverse transcriptase family protein [Posidoniimonas corsicana]TWT35529.1 Reverse transcriptase (RNA-dependent DNA polymerase) [Posidoniimonas corsicana]